jgi:hypothetical protein
MICSNAIDGNVPKIREDNAKTQSDEEEKRRARVSTSSSAIIAAGAGGGRGRRPGGCCRRRHGGDNGLPRTGKSTLDRDAGVWVTPVG